MVNMGGQKIANVANGTVSGDAVNKGQLDAVVAGEGGLLADGSVPMAGALDMDSHKIENVTDPTADQEAATKKYVDDTVDAVAEGMSDAKTDKILRGKVTLTGAASGLTEVAFGAATAALKMGTVAGPWDLHDPGNGGTIVIDPDGDGSQTATLNAAAGTHTGAVGASTDMSANPEDKFKISVDGADVVTVECDFVGETCNDGTKIAAEMQSKARTATSTLLTVAYSADGGAHYIFTSPTLGTNSSIAITAADDHDCSEELLLGTANGGVSAQGTGDCGDITAVTPEEMITLCEGDMAGLTITQGTGDDAGKLIFTSDSTGGASSITVGAGTLNAALGFTEAQVDYGANGLGYDGVTLTHSGDNEYSVALCPVGVAQGDLGAECLGVQSKAATGFNIACETAASAYQVDVIVIGLVPT